MELEELKARWSSLEEQLKKQEIMNEKLVREIRQTKAGPLSLLINYTYSGIAVCMLLIPFLICVYTRSHFLAFKSSIFIFAGLLVLAGGILGIYNVAHLKKIDFTRSVSGNIQLVRAYRINVKKQSVAMYIAGVIILLLCVIASLLSPNMETWRWAAILLAIPLATLLAYMEYKKIFKAQTAAILKSLEELKELEEEK